MDQSAGFTTQLSLSNNQYLITIANANNVLSKHKFDIPKSNKTKIKIQTIKQSTSLNKKKIIYMLLRKKEIASVVEKQVTSFANVVQGQATGRVRNP
jgi:hypothetical protein